MSQPASQPRGRRVLIGAALTLMLLLLAFRGGRLVDPAVLGVADFVEYWSAGRLNATGGNPYDPEQLLPLQQQAGWTDTKPIPMWNPPWTLTVVMPFGLLSFPASRLVWLLFELALVLGCADWLWRYYGGPVEERWLAWLAALSYCPCLVVLHMGQVGPLILLGLVLFLALVRRWPAWAGASLVLVTIKPHVVYLFGAVVLLWTLDRRRSSLFAGAGLAVLLAAAIPYACNPLVFRQYQAASTSGLVTDCLECQTPTLGTVLRLGIAPECSWIAYLPMGVGLVWLIAYWRQRRQGWNWSEQTPLLVLVSCCTMLYGWLGDLVVLLPAVIQAATWLARCRSMRMACLAITGYAALDAVILVAKINSVPEFWLAWVAPALLSGYLLLRHLTCGRQVRCPTPDTSRPVLLSLERP